MEDCFCQRTKNQIKRKISKLWIYTSQLHVLN